MAFNRITICLFSALLLVALSCKKQTTTTQKEVTHAIPKDQKWSERMAQSIMHRHPKAWQTENDSIPEWDYKIGLLMTAFQQLHQATNDSAYYNYMLDYAQTMIDSDGTIADYDQESYNIDLINPGKFLFDIYDQTKDTRYLKALQTLRKQLESHPRTNAGGFWHKQIYPYQMWLDGLYMGTPFYARYNVTYENANRIDDIIHQYDEIQAHLVDEKTGLLFHGWDESKQMDWADQQTGRSPGFWSRALGWYAMAFVDVLDYIPQDHPERAKLIQYLNDLAKAIAQVQDEETGLWYQVPDQPNREGNYLEASSSCMFTYAFAKGAQKGYLEAEYMAKAEKAFQGIVDELIEVDPNGEVNITQICGSAGLGGNPYRDGTYDYYISEKIKVNNLHGTGPFILAALAVGQ
ncbi:MAG: glycoside hydrolase family 88 protein [Saprospiraceae bacterium]|nr:glycoside hydrolase family 88 protein [Saprospiraceae bacterium]